MQNNHKTSAPNKLFPRWHPEMARGWTQRHVFEGTLVLQEATHLGGGDTALLVDLPLLTDARTGQPLLSGATLAGALRDYLKKAGVASEHIEALFGNERANKNTFAESRVIVQDALGAKEGTHVELRDGVRLEPTARTSADQALYTLETWAAGTRFPLRFELRQEADADPEVIQALITALDALGEGKLAFGSRKRRGYGSADVSEWKHKKYNLSQPTELLAWLRNGAESLTEDDKVTSWKKAVDIEPFPDRRRRAEIEATLSIHGSLLIRTAGVSAKDPDMVHLKARQADGESKPILSGSSLAGALRAQATRIVNTLASSKEQIRTVEADEDLRKIIEDLFGPDLNRKGTTPRASRLRVRTAVIEDSRADLVQQRVSIDRFTGGSYPGALFSQQPVFGLPTTHLKLKLFIDQPEDFEIGLLLLLLKDLSQGLLPVGGEQSVGRGLLKGKAISLSCNLNGVETTFNLGANVDKAQLDDAEIKTLNGYMTALKEAINNQKKTD